MSDIYTPRCFSIIRFLLLLFACIFCLSIYDDASAQSMMTGGGYSLTGGVSVFSTDANGGGYSMTNTGDSVGTQSSAGGYSLYTTSFGVPVMTQSGSSGSEGTVSSAGGGTTGGGFTASFAQAGGRSMPVFDSNRPVSGMSWIDPGTGVDTDFDGDPDAFAGMSSGTGSRNASGTMGSGTSTGGNGGQSNGDFEIKTHDNGFGSAKTALLVVLIIGALLFAFRMAIGRGMSGH